jgi:3-deoxy-D-manno-octulosonic-acid transferase
MQRFWIWFYNVLVVPVLWVGILVAAIFKRKVRRGIRGRQNLFALLTRLRPADYGGQASHIPPAHVPPQSVGTSAGGYPTSRTPKRIWFHSSSLGEFEQAKPIIAELKRRFPNIVVMVSFFSPSGYDHTKNYKLADIITYIPFDSYRNARRFIDTLKPDAAVMVRYDIWPNHVWALRKKSIPIFLANATMRRHSPRHFPLVRSFHHSVYNMFDHILTVSEQDVEAFKQFGLSSPVLAAIGDTRYDQVWQRSIEAKTKHLLPTKVTTKRRIIVVGSSWDSDEEVLIPALNKLVKKSPKLLIILVPHEPTLSNIERIERELNAQLTSIRFSDLHDYKNEGVIIIDSVGILMPLYQYADISYVGGSFKQGVHNVLEPAVYGSPVVFGSVHDNSQEATQLAREGAAFVARNEEELYRHFHTLLSDESHRRTAGSKAQAFVKRNIGATERFLSYLEKVL